MSDDRKRRYLAVDDYGTGGIWFVIAARSEDEIHQHLRDVTVYAEGAKPDWMSDEMLHHIGQRRTFDIDDLPDSEWMRRLQGA